MVCLFIHVQDAFCYSCCELHDGGIRPEVNLFFVRMLFCVIIWTSLECDACRNAWFFNSISKSNFYLYGFIICTFGFYFSVLVVGQNKCNESNKTVSVSYFCKALHATQGAEVLCGEMSCSRVVNLWVYLHGWHIWHYEVIWFIVVIGISFRAASVLRIINIWWSKYIKGSWLTI